MIRKYIWVMVLFAIIPVVTLADNPQYTCPMHPHYISDEMGTCPICGMDLVPVKGEYNTPTGHNMSHVMEQDEHTRMSVIIAPETIQNMGVRIEKAQITEFGKNIRSYGLVSENIRLQQDISSRVDGWIEELEATAEGDVVKEGDLLFTLYSPELVSSQQDYISALVSGSKGRIDSAKKRLKSLGVQEKVLSGLKKNRKKLDNIPFYATANGVISKLNIKTGSHVKSGMQIAEIQDYSSVWINVSVAEKDLRFLNKSSSATVSFPNLGGKKHIGQIDYIYPTINSTSRTGQVRLVLDNPEGILRPGAYTDVDFETDIEKRLSVPSEAVLKSSEGDFVVVAEGDGRFQPRKVETGIHSLGHTAILSGIAQDDDIVVSGQFLIDSESSLRESFRKMQKAGASAGGRHEHH